LTAGKNGHTALHVAADKGNKELVIELIQGFCSPFVTNKDNKTALDLAISNQEALKAQAASTVVTVVENVKDKEQVEKLAAKQPVDYKDKKTAIDLKIYKYTQIINLLSEYSDPKTLVTAVEKGKGNEQVEKLLAAKFPIDYKDDKSGNTLLHIAKAKAVIESLLSAKCDIYAGDNEGNTALHTAAELARVGVVTLLLTKMSQNVQNKIGWTPLHSAVNSIVAHEQCTKVILPLLESKANIDATDQDGWTPLHYAVNGKETDVVLTLLEKKANVNAVDMQANTPLHVSVLNGSWGNVNVLIKKGANVDAKDMDGKTPKDLARVQMNEKIITLLSNK